MELLHERGLKGKPSVSECRKLKKKFEREKEVSELNTSNIITSNGTSLFVKSFSLCKILIYLLNSTCMTKQGDLAAV